MDLLKISRNPLNNGIKKLLAFLRNIIEGKDWTFPTCPIINSIAFRCMRLYSEWWAKE